MSDLRIAELTVEPDPDVALPADLTEDAITALSLHVLQAEGAAGDWTLGFRFVGDGEMQRMHREFMGLDSPTDIMTFPLDADVWAFGDEDTAETVGGDIVISVDTAASQASEGGWGVDDELRFLVVHGLLHLLGWDDHADADRAAMLDRQRALLESWLGAR